jgi:hypothetical protein
MRIVTLAALALFAAATPAAAQMCGPGQQSQASSAAPNTGMSGMMCGGAKAEDDPMADKPAEKQQTTGMCPCCRNMAMMRGGMRGMQHDMPGMDMPNKN